MPLPLLFALMLAALAGCHPLPPPDGCTPGVYSCVGNRPHVCSPTQRTTPLSVTCPADHVCTTDLPSVRAPATLIAGCRPTGTSHAP